MGFSREDMEAYEKQAQTQIDDKKNPFDGATVAQAATAEQMAAVSAQNTQQAASQPDTDNEDDPSALEEGNSEDQSVTGADGTSDANADSSTASADLSGDTETDSGEDGGAGQTAASKPPQAPKKGSAAERIQELLDLTEGYKEFGALKAQELREAQAEIARLKGGGTVTPAPAPESKEAKELEELATKPMPGMEDPDVNFDADKLRVKTQKWVNAQIKTGIKTALTEFKGSTDSDALKTAVENKFSKFAETHPDWEKVVAKNQVLIANQLCPDASLVLAKSPLTADIVYHFGKNPDLAVSTAKLSPAEQCAVIGEIVAEIKAKKTAAASANGGSKKPDNKGQGNPAPGAQSSKQKSLTQAPPPPSPTRAGGRAQQRDVQDPNLDMNEFARRHREEKQAQRQANRKARGLA